MAEHRHEIRVDCDETCVVRLGGLDHVATVKNISFGGALVNFYYSPPSLHIGDKCSISMKGEFLSEYSCEVVRADTPTIALMFTGNHKFKAAEH